MKKLISKSILGFAMLAMLSACGGAANSTPQEAAQTFMKSMVEGDMELNAKVNHSDAWSVPPDFAIELANKYNLVGMSTDAFTYQEKEGDPKTIVVTWKDKEGSEQHFNLRFNQEKDGYFFVKMQ